MSEEQIESDFLKYPSLIHHDNEKDIQWWLDHYPQLPNLDYIAREKLDGANISVLIQPNGSLKVGRRTAWLKDNEKFYDVWGALDRIIDLLEFYKELSATFNVPYRLFFELHGKTINKRVYYSDTLDLTLLDVVQDGKWLTPYELFMSLGNHPRLTSYFSAYNRTIVGRYESLEEALNAPQVFNSLYSSKADNPAEGVVIRPWNENPHNFRGDWFVIKKKAPGFEEKEPKFKAVQQTELTELQKEFLTYINDNRVLSVFSKHGPIQSQQQIGDYIKLVMEDAKDDFFKVYPNLDKSDRETFRAGGNRVVPLLRKHIDSYGGN